LVQDVAAFPFKGLQILPVLALLPVQITVQRIKGFLYRFPRLRTPTERTAVHRLYRTVVPIDLTLDPLNNLSIKLFSVINLGLDTFQFFLQPLLPMAFGLFP
jgi:hypothetical protein